MYIAHIAKIDDKPQIIDILLVLTNWLKLALKRKDFLKEPFKRLGQQWQAVELGKGRRINTYKCQPVSSDENEVWLDISQVQKAIRSGSS